MCVHSIGLLEEDAVLSLAAAHSLTPAQLLLRWGLSRGYSVIPKSASPRHILENASLLDSSNAAAAAALTASELDTPDMKEIAQTRRVDGAGLLKGKGKDQAISSLAELWEEQQEKPPRE